MAQLGSSPSSDYDQFLQQQTYGGGYPTVNPLTGLAYSPEELDIIRDGQMRQAEYYRGIERQQAFGASAASLVTAAASLSELFPTEGEEWDKERIEELEKTSGKILPEDRALLGLIGKRGRLAQRELGRQLAARQAVSGDRTTAGAQVRGERETRRGIGEAVTAEGIARLDAARKARKDFVDEIRDLKDRRSLSKFRDRKAIENVTSSAARVAGLLLGGRAPLTAEAKATEDAALKSMRADKSSAQLADSIKAKIAKSEVAKVRGQDWKGDQDRPTGAARLPGQRISARERAERLDAKIIELQEEKDLIDATRSKEYEATLGANGYSSYSPALVPGLQSTGTFSLPGFNSSGAQKWRPTQ